MMNKKIVQFYSFAILLLVLLSGSYTYADSIYSDIEGHWAKDSIMKWSDYGVIKGSGGKFRPNDTISRAEMIVIINRLIECPEETHSAFIDVDPNAWYASDVFAMARQSFVRHEGNLFNPNTQVTREEATETLAIAFGVSKFQTYKNDWPFTDFKDMSEISELVYPTLKEMVREGFVSGYSDGTFKPNKKVTRGEFARILDNMLDNIITTPGVYSGPYTPNLLILSDGVILDSGNELDKVSHIYISPSLGEGLLSIKNTLIKETNVYGYFGFNSKLIGKQPYPSILDKQARYVVPPVYQGFSSGYGTKDFPYCIDNEDQLRLLHNYVIDRVHQEKYDYFKLTSDIVLTKPWTSIGYTPEHIYTFSNYFDGSGHTISNMNISGSDQCASLIAESHGSISNLTVQGNIEIKANSNNTLYAAGGIVGNLYGKLENCSSRVNISVIGGEVVMVGGLVAEATENGRIYNCTYDGKLVAEATPQTTSKKGINAYVGGILGYSYLSPMVKLSVLNNPRVTPVVFKMRDCTSSGDYTAKTLLNSFEAGVSAYAGGLVGLGNYYTIQGSSSSASVSASGGYYNFAGGLAGILSDDNDAYFGAEYIKSNLVESYATGNISASGASYQNNAGGAVGQVNIGILQSCFATGNVSSTGEPAYFNAVGGLVGSVYDYGILRDGYATGNASSKGGGLVGAVVGRVKGSVERCYGTGKAFLDAQLINGQNQNLYIGNWSSEILTNFYHDLKSSEGIKGLVYLCFGNGKEAVVINNKDIFKSETYKQVGFDMDNTWFMSGSGYPLPKLRGVNEALQEGFSVPERF